MKRYHFSCGNSSDGPIGFCASVRANSPEEALEKLHSIGEHVSIRDTDRDVEYAEVYISTDNVTLDDIDAVECDCDDESCADCYEQDEDEPG
jgi:hypothetical protein